jgi:hypothetical protein
MALAVPCDRWGRTRGGENPQQRRKMRRLFVCFVCFLLSVPITSETDPRPNGGEHGLDHPGVAIDVRKLKCKCKDSDHATTSSGREYGGDERSIQASACREEDQVYWISCTSSYTVRYPLQRIQKTRVMNIDENGSDAYTAQKGPFVVEVNLRDMHPGLTNEETLIGTRRLDSSVNTVLVHCDLEPAEREEPLHSSPANTASDDTDSTVGGRGGGDSLYVQFILDAVKPPESDIRDAPVESTRHEDHQRRHERLARGSTNVRNTTTTGKTKMEPWRESVRPAYQQSIASDNLPSSGRASASGMTQDKSADTITVEEIMRGVIAQWYTNYSAVDQSYNPIPVNTIPGVLDMATSQTMAAGLVFQNFNTHSAGSPREATATKTAQLEIEEGRNSSVHRCKGTLKSQCLLFDVCFALDHHAGSSTTT